MPDHQQVWCCHGHGMPNRGQCYLAAHVGCLLLPFFVTTPLPTIDNHAFMQVLRWVWTRSHHRPCCGRSVSCSEFSAETSRQPCVLTCTGCVWPFKKIYSRSCSCSEIDLIWGLKPGPMVLQHVVIAGRQASLGIGFSCLIGVVPKLSC